MDSERPARATWAMTNRQRRFHPAVFHLTFRLVLPSMVCQFQTRLALSACGLSSASPEMVEHAKQCLNFKHGLILYLNFVTKQPALTQLGAPLRVCRYA
eukprot:11476263-Alexandrium_andersonii.AAC.1